MPATVYGPIIFGIPDPLPEVPAGWELHPAEDEFLRATGPDGLPYHIMTGGRAMLIVSELPDYVKLEDVKPRKVVPSEEAEIDQWGKEVKRPDLAAQVAKEESRCVWVVEGDGQEVALCRDGEAVFVMKGAIGRQTLERLAGLFNRARVTPAEIASLHDFLMF